MVAMATEIAEILLDKITPSGLSKGPTKPQFYDSRHLETSKQTMTTSNKTTRDIGSVPISFIS